MYRSADGKVWKYECWKRKRWCMRNFGCLTSRLVLALLQVLHSGDGNSWKKNIAKSVETPPASLGMGHMCHAKDRHRLEWSRALICNIRAASCITEIAYTCSAPNGLAVTCSKVELPQQSMVVPASNPELFICWHSCPSSDTWARTALWRCPAHFLPSAIVWFAPLFVCIF